ncbi:MAG: VanZ family protein [Clostridia bacterium]|nr:VanZ family protein [Clostridia bacterium]
MDNIKKRLAAAVLFWALTAATMVMIFMFSSDTGEESAQLSGGLLARIIIYIGSAFSENTLRKLAHFTEFMSLGFFTAGGMYFSFNTRRPYAPLIPCVLYAVSDEIHQYYIPDRACRVLDVFIDSCGSLAGILIFLLILTLIKRTRAKNNKQDNG